MSVRGGSCESVNEQLCQRGGGSTGGGETGCAPVPADLPGGRRGAGCGGGGEAAASLPIPEHGRAVGQVTRRREAGRGRQGGGRRRPVQRQTRGSLARQCQRKQLAPLRATAAALARHRSREHKPKRAVATSRPWAPLRATSHLMSTSVSSPTPGGTTTMWLLSLLLTDATKACKKDIWRRDRGLKKAPERAQRTSRSTAS